MKIKPILIIASTIAMSSVTAEPLIPNEICAAIDSESEYVENRLFETPTPLRMNYDLFIKEQPSNSSNNNSKVAMNWINDHFYQEDEDGYDDE